MRFLKEKYEEECGAVLQSSNELLFPEKSAIFRCWEDNGAVAPNRAVARTRAPRSGANGAAQRR